MWCNAFRQSTRTKWITCSMAQLGPYSIPNCDARAGFHFDGDRKNTKIVVGFVLALVRFCGQTIFDYLFTIYSYYFIYFLFFLLLLLLLHFLAWLGWSCNSGLAHAIFHYVRACGTRLLAVGEYFQWFFVHAPVGSSCVWFLLFHILRFCHFPLTETKLIGSTITIVILNTIY